MHKHNIAKMYSKFLRHTFFSGIVLFTAKTVFTVKSLNWRRLRGSLAAVLNTEWFYWTAHQKVTFVSYRKSFYCK